MNNLTRGIITSEDLTDIMKNLNSTQNKDSVDHPDHYAEGREYEPIDVINDWELNFQLGNVIKYISRAGRKDNIIEDLEKASFYLTYEINRLKSKMNHDKND